MPPLEIPARFWDVRYDQNHDPHRPLLSLAESPNCQNFAYELLREFGRRSIHFRSSELWEDREHTVAVTDLEPLDLLLFHRRRSPWGAHVAVYIGDDRAIHLSKKVGRPAIWSLSQFMERPEYAIMIGAKRVLVA